MTAKTFIDTNIFVYAFVEDQTDKHVKVKDFLNNLNGEIVASVQVLNELYAVLLKYGLQDKEIQNLLNRLKAEVEILPLTLSVVVSAWRIKTTFQLAYWDALIVSSAIEANCAILSTEDLQHGQLIKGQLKVSNPFKQ